MRLGVQKSQSDPFNVSLDQGIGLEGIKAALRRIIKAWGIMENSPSLSPLIRLTALFDL